MRELHDQVYSSAASIQGSESVKKSSSSNGSSTVLGRFLKLGKSKSDVHGSNSNFIKRRALTSGSTTTGDDLEDDFTLSPIQLRGVEKMVHKANMRKDVSRSHSWIFGSVKLPSDLPYGYGYGTGTSASMQQHMSTGTDGNSGSSSMQLIPRCQMTEFCNCPCEYGGPEDFSFLAGGAGPGPSNSALLALAGITSPRNNPNSSSTCQACQNLIVLGGKYAKSGNRKDSQDSTKKAFGNSVRKLTWKSLKQAVKKRPSLDSLNLRKPATTDGGVMNSSKEFTNFSQNDFLTTSTNYFFPEKKNNGFYGSCTELYANDSPHVTASVRVRPKRSRQTWNFPNEFGPTPNYQAETQHHENEMYHSEWDLRQVVPYEEWITTTSSSLNPTVNPLAHDAFDTLTNSVKMSNGRGSRSSNANSSNNSSNSEMYTNGGVKRFSILQSEVSAYHLNKAANGEGEESESEDTSDSDDLGENATSVLTEDPVRIAGQGICMPFPSNSSNSSGAGSSSNRVARSNSSASSKFNGSSSSTAHKGKGNHPHHLLLASSSTMEADGLWSDPQTAQQQPSKQNASLASRERDHLNPQDKVKTEQEALGKSMNTFQSPPASSTKGHYAKGSNGTGTTRLILNDSNSFPVPASTASTAKTTASKSDNVRKSTNVFVNGKSTKSSSESKDKYGALRRRKGRSGPGKNLLRETIYEEESEHLDDDEVFAVKIVVTQTGASDYVKPILKTRSPYATPSGIGEDDTIYDDVSGASATPLTRSPKKVQFNSAQEVVVCGGLTDPDDEEGDDEPEPEVRAGGSHSANVEDETETEEDEPKPESDEDEEAEPERKSGCHSMAGRKEQNEPIKQAADDHEEEVAQVSRVKVKKRSPTNRPTQSATAVAPTSNANASTTASSSIEVNNPNNESKRQQLHQALKALADENSMRKNLKPAIKAQLPKHHPGTTQEEPVFQGNDTGNNATVTTTVVSKPVQPNATNNTRDRELLGTGKGKAGQSQKIINPNSLLFNDTTRIRLNQSRPSLEHTFDLNLSSTDENVRGSSASANKSSGSRKVRPSQSFRSNQPLSATTVAPRPREPPPPPPRISSAPPRPLPPKPALPPKSSSQTTNGSHYRAMPTNKSQISLPMPQLGFSTTNNAVKEPKVVPPSHYHNSSVFNNNKAKSRSLAEKCEAVEKMLSQQIQSRNTTVNGNSHNTASNRVTPADPPALQPRKDTRPMALPAPISKANQKQADSQNIEIVTKENSVSEIRIYSGTKVLNINPEIKQVQPKPVQNGSEIHYAATDLFKINTIPESQSTRTPDYNSSRPQSTSVVLIMNSGGSDSTAPQSKVKLGASDPPGPPPLPPLNPKPRIEDKRPSLSVGQSASGTQSQVVENLEEEDPLYDDVINHSASKAEMNTKPVHHEPQQQLKRGPTNNASTSDRRVIDTPPPNPPPPVPPPNRKSVEDAESLHSVYSDVGNGLSVSISSNCEADRQADLLYDDTLSVHTNYEPRSQEAFANQPCQTKEAYPRLINQLVAPNKADTQSATIIEEEPMYDDVLNLIHTEINGPKSLGVDRDSDSGTETDVPPPLPTSGPPVLPKVSLDLPLIPLPALVKSKPSSISKGTSRLFGEIMGIGKKISGGDNNRTSVKFSPDVEISQPNEKPEPEALPEEMYSDVGGDRIKFLLDIPEAAGEDGEEDDVLDRTRTLLNELNDKLAKLSFSPEDYSTYISKVVIPSSSESSGVEEDYNSEKNYSLSNGSGSGGSSTASLESDNYKLSAVSKLVSETISMARGKFLDSMKVNQQNQSQTSPVPSPSDDEPIYEEINENGGSSATTAADAMALANSLLLRSTSPVYADAFDAKSIFDGASRNEILSFLESIRDRLTAAESTNTNDSRQNSVTSKKSRKFAEIERNDSGIGSEAGSLVAVSNGSSGNASLRLLTLCQDCNDSPVDPRLTPNSSGATESGETCKSLTPHQLCRSCTRRRSERREIIQEIYETELKYGRDLRIILDEFYNPIQIAGLLTKDQLDQIFLNVTQLIEINTELTEMLKHAIEDATSTEALEKDEDLNSVNVGRLFLEIGERMMSVFESYCMRQASAGALLTQLEKEKELLRIFLRVSQMENTVLRRMNLPAFLMVPVQRVTRYPLLLSRLLKVTVPDHSSRDELQLAQEKIEQHLEHMNKTTREVASVKLWRRISIINGGGNSTPTLSATPNRRANNELDGASVRIRKMALDALEWGNCSDVTCVIESQLHIVQCQGKTLKNIHACLLARGKDLESLALKMDQDVFFPPTADDAVKEVKLVLVRVKNSRFNFLREPLCLGKCVISQGENEFQDFIEINEITTKNTYYLQGMDKPGTSVWLRLLQCHAVCVGQWRRRRGALANIMMNGMIRHL